MRWTWLEQPLVANSGHRWIVGWEPIRASDLDIPAVLIVIKGGIVRRQGLFEKDRMDPVDPTAVLKLDQDLLNEFPESYRHLGYLQTQVGFKVKRTGMPSMKGPEVEKLYAEGRAWLDGAPTPRELGE